MGKRRHRPQDRRKEEGNRQERGRRAWGGRPGGKGGNRGPRPEKAETQDFWSRLLGSGEDNDFLEKTACPACGNLSARILGRLGPTILRKCRACSLVYVSPRLADSVRRDMLRREPAPLSSERNLMLRHRMADRIELMHREMPSLDGMAKRSSTLLEIGCRWGHFLQLCRPHYRSVEGLEWSKERAAFARERFDLDVSAADILRDPWAGRYNFIVAWELMEREPHPLEVLRWMHDHLLPGGQIVLSTPNYDSLSRRLLRKRWRHFDPARRLVYFTPSTITALLTEAGFREVVVRTSGMSSIREWLNRYNRVDRGRDARSQWLQTLRGREAVDSSRRAEGVSPGRESPLRKAWKRLAGLLGPVLAAPGWGDEMRVYARKS